MNTLDAPVFGSDLEDRSGPEIDDQQVVWLTGLKPSPSVCAVEFAMGTFLSSLPFGLKTKSKAGPGGSLWVLKPNVET